MPPTKTPRSPRAPKPAPALTLPTALGFDDAVLLVPDLVAVEVAVEPLAAEAVEAAVAMEEEAELPEDLSETTPPSTLGWELESATVTAFER